MNAAAETGPQRFPWWPDWRGQCAAIVASGPSLKGASLSMLRDRIHVLAIKASIDLCPWADVCYGCDAPWWIDRKGLPKFKGVKLFHGVGAANRWPDLHRVEIDMRSDAMLVEEPLKISNGGNSGHQALNLAIQFGATDIVLIGLDLHGRGGLHWYGRNTWLNANNPMQSNFDRWQKGFEAARKDLDRMGITVINASMSSELKCFRKVALGDIMKEWGL